MIRQSTFYSSSQGLKTPYRVLEHQSNSMGFNLAISDSPDQGDAKERRHQLNDIPINTNLPVVPTEATLIGQLQLLRPASMHFAILPYDRTMACFFSADKTISDERSRCRGKSAHTNIT